MKMVWHFKNYAIVAAALLCFAVNSSCSFKPATTDGHQNESIISFKKVSVDTTMALFSNYEKPDCHLQLSFDVPMAATSNGALEIAKTMIVTMTQEGNYAVDGSNNVEAMIRNYTKTYIRSYLEEGNDAIANFGNDFEAAASWMSYEEKCDGKTLYNDNGIFSYSVKNYSYTGGAHGNGTNCVASIDLGSQCNITLETLFSAVAIDQVRMQIVGILNQNYQLLSDEIEVTQNFYLSDKGITFVYDPFEIAAYSEGEIAITLDWNSVRPLIAEGSMLASNPLVKVETAEL